jgi:hypothetical protein
VSAELLARALDTIEALLFEHLMKTGCRQCPKCEEAIAVLHAAGRR